MKAMLTAVHEAWKNENAQGRSFVEAAKKIPKPITEKHLETLPHDKGNKENGETTQSFSTLSWQSIVVRLFTLSQ